MKLERLPYAPDALVDFYDEALTALGALCERTWHDHLRAVAAVGRIVRIDCIGRIERLVAVDRCGVGGDLVDGAGSCG